MVMEVKWCGFDYGQCIMEPGGLRNPRLYGDLYKDLGRPELIPDKIRKYRILKEKYGSYGRIKEGHRDEIYSFVLDDDPKAIELFGQKEQELLDMGEGLEDALDYLQSQGIELQVVSEMKKTLGAVGTDIVSRFLKRRGLVEYFTELVTPQGKINLIDSMYSAKMHRQVARFEYHLTFHLQPPADRLCGRGGGACASPYGETSSMCGDYPTNR